MEKKKNIWVGKIVVIVLIIVSIGSYYVFPSVKHVMNQVFKMFASGDFAVVRDFVASYGACKIQYFLYGIDFIFAYDFSVDCSATSGISDYICKCESFWMVAGSYSVMEQCDGRSSGMLFHCKNTWT